MVLKHIQDVNTKKTGLKRYIQDGVQDGCLNLIKIGKKTFFITFWADVGIKIDTNLFYQLKKHIFSIFT